jgi:hypothetical protein
MKKGILYVCLAVLFWQGAAFAAFIDNGNGTMTLPRQEPGVS